MRCYRDKCGHDIEHDHQKVGDFGEFWICLGGGGTKVLPRPLAVRCLCSAPLEEPEARKPFPPKGSRSAAVDDPRRDPEPPKADVKRWSESAGLKVERGTTISTAPLDSVIRGPLCWSDACLAPLPVGWEDGGVVTSAKTGMDYCSESCLAEREEIPDEGRQGDQDG
jgi:hypothetical protein